VSGDKVAHLEQKRRLADARIAAKKHNGSRHNAAAEDAVELLEREAKAAVVDAFDFGQRDGKES
jgi:hypothetical protein